LLARLIQRMRAHGPRNASAECADRNNIAAVGDVGAAAPIVRAQIVGSEDGACVLGHEHAVPGRVPIGKCVRARNIARNWAGLASAERRRTDSPAGVLVCLLGRTNIHYSAASWAGPRVSFGLSSQASSQLNTFSDFTTLPTPSVCAQSKPSSMISSSLKWFERSR